MSDELPAELMRAARLAVKAHDGQVRKGSKLPYVMHPLSVAERVARGEGVPATANRRTMLLAAVLHDSLEDTELPPEQISREFGEEVLAVVRELTQDMSLPKAERKKRMVEGCGQMSLEARVVKLADRWDNLTAMDLLSEKFQEKYSVEARGMLEKLAGTWTQAEDAIRELLREE